MLRVAIVMGSRNGNSNQTGGSFSRDTTCGELARVRWRESVDEMGMLWLWLRSTVQMWRWKLEATWAKFRQTANRAPLLNPSPSSSSFRISSPHGRCRLSLVRHDEENKVTAKLIAEDLVLARLGQMCCPLFLPPHLNRYTSRFLEDLPKRACTFIY